MNLQSFTGSSTIEDPYNITEKMRKVYEVMHIDGIEIAELASYQLKGLDRLGLISGRRVYMNMHHLRVGIVLRRPS